MQENFSEVWERNMNTDIYKIILTDTAKLDLEEIYEYINKKLKEHNLALKITSKIEKNILSLENNPYRYMEVKIKRHNIPYRRLIVGKYIVLYRIKEEYKEVIISSIIYGKSDYLQ